MDELASHLKIIIPREIMQQRLILAIMILLTSFDVSAQNYKVDWGPTYKKDGGLFGSYYLIGMYQDHYYVMMNPKNRNTLLQYDMSHKLVSNKKLDMRYNGRNININRIIHTKNGTFGYLSTYDKKEKKQRIFVSKFKDGTFGDVKEIYSHPFKVQVKFIPFGITNYTNVDASTLLESADSSHVVYTNINSSIDDKDKEEISVVVFDANMDIVWKKTQQLKYQDKKIDINQAVVGNDGTVYILAVVGNKKKEKGLPKYDFKAFRITNEGMEEYQLELGDDMAPMDVGIYLPTGKQEMVLAGFYTDADRKSGAKGVFYASGNADTGVSNVNTHELETSFLKGLVEEKDIEKNRGLYRTFYIKDFIKFKDGSVSFIAEKNYITSQMIMNSEGRMQNNSIYHTDELIIARFSDAGELLSIQKVDKEFKSRSLLNTSYALALYNSKTYLIFNDDKTRTDLKEMGGRKKRLWRYTDLVVINEEGEIEHNETVFNSNEIDLEFVPFMSDYSKDKFLIMSLSLKKYAFGTIELH